MKQIVFESNLNGVKRVAVPKLEVEGYTHRRHHIGRCIYHTYEKDNITYRYEELYQDFIKFNPITQEDFDVTYNEFNKFIDTFIIKDGNETSLHKTLLEDFKEKNPDFNEDMPYFCPIMLKYKRKSNCNYEFKDEYCMNCKVCWDMSLDEWSNK